MDNLTLVWEVEVDKNILEELKAKNQASTLQFVENAHIEGTVFQRYTIYAHIEVTYTIIPLFQWHPVASRGNY
ncbi:hypothetical protein MTR_2g075810 [Medicago truncatula]|uniref:Uncharacterized protein n=1 Tax=Medicago truncatula TaxID=3880 RepID=G7ITE5_MEDTR|nr:hypothetical protein MTR_2g075810 [Medicago truncatula]